MPRKSHGIRARYDQAALDEAVRNVNFRKMSLTEAAICFKIPTSTIHRHVKGKVEQGTKAGRRQYSCDAFEQAVRMVNDGKMSLGKASIHFNVPKSTLQWHVKSKAKPGPNAEAGQADRTTNPKTSIREETDGMERLHASHRRHPELSIPHYPTAHAQISTSTPTAAPECGNPQNRDVIAEKCEPGHERQ